MLYIRTILSLAIAPILLVGLTQCKEGSSNAEGRTPSDGGTPEKPPTQQKPKIAVADFSAVLGSFESGTPSADPRYFAKQKELLDELDRWEEIIGRYEERIEGSQLRVQNAEKALASADPENKDTHTKNVERTRGILADLESQLEDAKRKLAGTPKPEIVDSQRLREKLREAESNQYELAWVALENAIKHLFSQTEFNVVVDNHYDPASNLAGGVPQNADDVTSNLVGYFEKIMANVLPESNSGQRLRVARADLEVVRQSHAGGTAGSEKDFQQVIKQAQSEQGFALIINTFSERRTVFVAGLNRTEDAPDLTKELSEKIFKLSKQPSP